MTINFLLNLFIVSSFISLKSFPLDIPLDEAEWYVDNVLPKSKPKPAELFVHQFGLKNYRLALFSYINPKSGCLSRHRFCVIYQPEKKSVDYDRVVNSYKTGIINYGGFATVELVPEVRWNAINVMMGDPKPSWTQYHVNLYSFRLVKDASQSHTFDYTDIDRYKLSLKPPSRVNINYLSQLV